MGDRGQRQIIVGMIVSDKMQKTVKVEVKRKVLHPIYKKYITKKKKFSADTGKFECSNGDTVKIVSSKPISKTKSGKYMKLLRKITSFNLSIK